MSQKHFHTVEDIFHRAREIERSALGGFLHEACGTDRELRAEVESLLSHDGERSASALEIRTGLTEGPGERIGRYKLLQEIGAGLVYTLFASTSAPTQTNIDGYAIIAEEFPPILDKVRKLVNEDLKNLQDQLMKLGAPYTPYTLPGVPEFKP